jgi:hypothetical protein
VRVREHLRVEVRYGREHRNPVPLVAISQRKQYSMSAFA